MSIANCLAKHERLVKSRILSFRLETPSTTELALYSVVIANSYEVAIVISVSVSLAMNNTDTLTTQANL